MSDFSLENSCKWKVELVLRCPRIFRLALATHMATFAIDVGSLLHSLTLRAAIFPRSDFTGTDRMGALPALARGQVCVSFIEFK